MSAMHVYPPEVEAREHVFEPLRPMSGAYAGGAGYPNVRHYDLEEIQREAYERGLEEGKAAVEEELTRVVRAAAEAVERWRAESESCRETMKHDMLRLSLAIAKQVLMAELKTRPEVIAEIVHSLLNEAEGRKVFALHLNPEDVERLRQSPVMAVLEQSEIELRPTPDVAPGGCVLDTAFGRLDAQLETRVQELADSLLAADAQDSSAGGEEPS